MDKNVSNESNTTSKSMANECEAPNRIHCASTSVVQSIGFIPKQVHPYLNAKTWKSKGKGSQPGKCRIQTDTPGNINYWKTMKRGRKKSQSKKKITNKIIKQGG